MAFLGRPTERDEQRAEAYAKWLQKRNPYAIASLVLGIFSIIELGVLLVFGIAGVITGIVALVQLRQRAPDAPMLAERADRQHRAGIVSYASAGIDVPPDRRAYEDDEQPPKTHGHRMAWTGIVLSAASLVIAGAIYVHSWSG